MLSIIIVDRWRSLLYSQN